MNTTAIRVRNLGKRYQLGARERGYRTFREAIVNAAKAPFQRFRRLSGRAASSEKFWALQDVSFDVQEGDVVGIIGRNGAGKSTLLKILSRITEPTTGAVELHGRVGSLLEVGTGFHPELTGRENIYLNGSILGMKRKEIDRSFDEIVAFADVEKFLDTPVKRYSSGMYVRLAFAVAAHLNPEILIVDEVLAVGDAEFQKKCLGKMGAVAHEGRTVLFVSHNMAAVRTLCRNAFFLEEGRLQSYGAVSEVIARYLGDCESAEHASKAWLSPERAPGPFFLKLKGIAVQPEDKSKDAIDMQTDFQIETQYSVLTGGVMAHLTFHLINQEGVIVLTTASRPEMQEPGTYRAICHVPGSLLNSGGYSLRLLVVRNGSEHAFKMENVVSFNVVDAAPRDHAYLGREPGVVQPPLKWEKIVVG